MPVCHFAAGTLKHPHAVLDIYRQSSYPHAIAQTFERPFGITLFVAEAVSASLQLAYLGAQLGAIFVAQLSSVQEVAFA